MHLPHNHVFFLIDLLWLAVWLLLFLSANPEWKKKVTDEVNSLISTHTNTTSTDPLHKRLSAIPISAWDEEMPVLESVVRETIRIVVNGATLRRNVSRDLKIAGKTVPKGAFMTYQLADIHLNPEIYTNPAEFDPDRFGPGREEDKKQAFGYMGWGGGASLSTYILPSIPCFLRDPSPKDATRAPG